MDGMDEMAQYNDAQLTSYVDQLFARLSRVEAQLALVSEKLGIPFPDATSGIPADVVAMVRAGDRLGAIKRLRELSNMTVDEAKAFIANV